MEEQAMVEEKIGEVEMPDDWKYVELTDVATGEKFKIADFKGKPILIESFAVWCPTCLRQQREMKKLIESDGDAIIHISLDTDPNEDEDAVRNHINRNDLDWFFAVAPTEVTKALVDEFGIGVVNAPGAPVILVCEDLSSRFLRSGVKSPDLLKQEITQGC
jgi:thiol-disulfide isomerase/thioredoxin